MAIRTLYHGSDRIISAPRYAYGDSERDFGAGFYCTENEKLARQWACRYAQPGIVNVYHMNTEYLYILDLTSDEHDVLEWVALILANRVFRITDSGAERRKQEILSEYLIDTTPYDAIIGVRADDSHFALIRSYLSGEFSDEELRKFISSEKSHKQIFFKNNKCFLMLEYQRSYLASQKDVYMRYQEDDDLRERIKKAGLKVLEHESNMGEMIEYVSEACHEDVNDFFRMMALTGLLDRWERWDPTLYYGMSGTEIARSVFRKVGMPIQDYPYAVVRMVSGVSDWAGRLLNYISFTRNVSTYDIIDRVDFEEVSDYYPRFYMSSIKEAAEALEKAYFDSEEGSMLSRLRKERGLSQKELSILSGVNLRTLQQYEIRAKDLKKASSEKVINLAFALRTRPENLLE